MSYTHAHYSSRTAGFNPGASVSSNVMNLSGRGTPPKSPIAGVQNSPDAATSPTLRASDFDTLLQEASAHPQTDTPPSGFAHNAAPAAGSHHTDFTTRDQFNGAFQMPQSPETHIKPAAQPGDSRTAGRTVSTPDQASYNANGEQQNFSFWDFLDIINPLQHIPIVSNIYRSLTGDEIAKAIAIYEKRKEPVFVELPVSLSSATGGQ